MGAQKQTSSSSGSNTTTYTMSPEERQNIALQNQYLQDTASGRTQLTQSGLDIGNRLLQGQELPGYLQPLPYGVSDDAVNASIQEGLRQLNPQFQQMGILNSGSAADISARFAGQQKLAQQQFNLQNLMQLLNIGVGGQAVPQAPIVSTQGQLGQSLAGLRTVNSTNQGSSNYTYNPFMQNFSGSSGSFIGNPFQTFFQRGI